VSGSVIFQLSGAKNGTKMSILDLVGPVVQHFSWQAGRYPWFCDSTNVFIYRVEQKTQKCNISLLHILPCVYK
jgi:hypothetical protein